MVFGYAREKFIRKTFKIRFTGFPSCLFEMEQADGFFYESMEAAKIVLHFSKNGFCSAIIAVAAC
jgi:hypothetical protein